MQIHWFFGKCAKRVILIRVKSVLTHQFDFFFFDRLDLIQRSKCLGVHHGLKNTYFILLLFPVILSSSFSIFRASFVLLSYSCHTSILLLCRTPSVLLSNSFHTSFVFLPNLFTTSSELLLHFFRTPSELLPLFFHTPSILIANSLHTSSQIFSYVSLTPSLFLQRWKNFRRDRSSA